MLRCKRLTVMGLIVLSLIMILGTSCAKNNDILDSNTEDSSTFTPIANHVFLLAIDGLN